MLFYIVDMRQQFQVEASVEVVWFQKAEKVRLNKKLYRKDKAVESSLCLKTKVFHCGGGEEQTTKPTFFIFIGETKKNSLCSVIQKKNCTSPGSI